MILARNRDYQPGNGTRYDLLLVEDGERDVLVWVGHGAMAFYGRELPAPRYVQEKLGCFEGDALALVGWLRSLGWST